MTTQVPFSVDGLQTGTDITATTFKYTDGEEVGLRPLLRAVDGNLVSTTNIVMSAQASAGFVVSVENSNTSAWLNAATGDAQGNSYAVGKNYETDRPMIYSFDSNGDIRWKVTIDNINGQPSNANNLVVYGDEVTVSFTYYDSNTDSDRMGVIVLDSTSGETIRSTLLDSPNNANPDITSMTLSETLGPIVVGDIRGEYQTINGLVAQSGSATDVLWLNSSDLPVGVVPWGSQTWQIDVSGAAASGTWANTNTLNQLFNLDTVTVTGSGTGMKVNVRWDGSTGTYDYVSFINGQFGTGYAEGDIVRVVGSLLGGVDGVNDCDFPLYYNGYYGTAIANSAGTGTPPSKALFYVSTGTDFAANGPYNVRLSLDQQAFVWTPNWQHTYGESSYQGFTDVAHDESTGETYLLGEFYKQISSTYYQVCLTKLDSSGNTLYSKYVEYQPSMSGNPGGVAIATNGGVFVVAVDNNGYTVVTKLSSEGSVLWQKRQEQSEWDNQPKCSTDANGDLYIVGVYYNGNDDVMIIIKLNGDDGSFIYARTLGNVQNLNMYEYNDDDCRAFNIVGSSIYIGGYVYDVNDNNYVGYATKLATDGTGAGTYGRWVYSEFDNDVTFNDTTSDALLLDSNQGTPTDLVSQTPLSDEAFVSSGAGDNAVEVTSPMSASGGAIRFADGSSQATAANTGEFLFSDTVLTGKANVTSTITAGRLDILTTINSDNQSAGVSIYTDSNGDHTNPNGRRWYFENNGTLTFPDDTQQTTAYTGPSSVLPYAWAEGLYLRSGGEGQDPSWITPTAVAIYGTQQGGQTIGQNQSLIYVDTPFTLTPTATIICEGMFEGKEIIVKMDGTVGRTVTINAYRENNTVVQIQGSDTFTISKPWGWVRLVYIIGNGGNVYQMLIIGGDY